MSLITRHVRISNLTISDNDGIVYQQQGIDLDEFLDGAMKSLQIAYPKFYKMDRLSKLGFLATELLLQGRKIVSDYRATEVAVVLSNAHSSLDTDARYLESTRTIASPALFVYTLTNIVTGEICIRHGIKGENAFFVSEEFDPQLIVSYVESVLLAGYTRACVAGWVDVIDSKHDVFLYLVETSRATDALNHTPEIVKELYRK